MDDVQQFEERHPAGTKARLASALLLHGSQRRSDVIRFGKQHARGGKLTFTQHKGTDGSFGNKFRDWYNQAELYRCSAHGLRKMGVTVAANNGATTHQLMAIFGWDTIKKAEKYIAKADQKRLAESAMHLLDARPK